jgi:hypothetical protein
MLQLRTVSDKRQLSSWITFEHTVREAPKQGVYAFLSGHSAHKQNICRATFTGECRLSGNLILDNVYTGTVGDASEIVRQSKLRNYHGISKG